MKKSSSNLFAEHHIREFFVLVPALELFGNGFQGQQRVAGGRNTMAPCPAAQPIPETKAKKGRKKK
jgi:hypothetical protein